MNIRKNISRVIVALTLTSAVSIGFVACNSEEEGKKETNATTDSQGHCTEAMVNDYNSAASAHRSLLWEVETYNLKAQGTSGADARAVEEKAIESKNQAENFMKNHAGEHCNALVNGYETTVDTSVEGQVFLDYSNKILSQIQSNQKGGNISIGSEDVPSNDPSESKDSKEKNPTQNHSIREQLEVAY